MKKLIRITTIPLSLEKLLENQLHFMSDYYNVTAISAEKERLETFGQQQGISTFHLELTRQITPLKDLLAAWKLYKYLKSEQPFIVHTHTPKAGIVGMLAAYLAQVPNRLHTVAGLPLMEAQGLKRKILNLVEKFTYACATKVYPNSAELKRFIEAEKFTKTSKLKIIGNGSSNGIDTNYFDPSLFSESQKSSLRDSLHIAKQDIIFIFVGRLVSDKGINELVAAFKEVQLKKSNIKLILVGPFEDELDPLNPATKGCIEANDGIIATGYQQDVRPYLAISNILAFPSYREGFPNVVLQAGAMGLPAIVSDINGCNEIISQNINGIIIPKKSTKALVNTMMILLENTALYNNLQRNARRLIQEQYEREVLWKALLNEYKYLESNT